MDTKTLARMRLVDTTWKKLIEEYGEVQWKVFENSNFTNGPALESAAACGKQDAVKAIQSIKDPMRWLDEASTSKLSIFEFFQQKDNARKFDVETLIWKLQNMEEK